MGRGLIPFCQIRFMYMYIYILDDNLILPCHSTLRDILSVRHAAIEFTSMGYTFPEFKVFKGTVSPDIGFYLKVYKIESVFL